MRAVRRASRPHCLKWQLEPQAALDFPPIGKNPEHPFPPNSI
jgi:hypothetical protein